MFKYLIITPLIFLCSLVRAQHIVFDVSRSQPFFPHDAGFAGSSVFARMLHDAGYTVSVNSRRLDVLLDEDKRPNLLVMPPTVFQYHTESEVEAVLQYVKSGGNLLLVTEHENFFGNAKNANRFLRETGVEVLADRMERYGVKHFAEKYRYRANTGFTRKDSVIFYFPALIRLKDSTQAVAKTADGLVLASKTPLGAGNITVWADFEIIWNMTPTTGIRYGDNKTFVMETFRRLAGTPINITYAETSGKKNVWLNTNCFEANLDKLINYSPLVEAFEKRGYGVRYTNLEKGEPGTDDVYLMLCDCDSEKEMRFAQKFGRVFTAGFMSSDFWGRVGEFMDRFAATGYDVTSMRAAIDDVLAYDGYRPLPYHAQLEKGGWLFASRFSSGDSLQKMRAPIMLDSASENLKTAQFAAFNYFNITSLKPGMEVLLWGETHPGFLYPAPTDNQIALTPNPAPAQKVPVTITNGNHVFSGCNEVWRNDFADKKFQQRLLKNVLDALEK